MITLKEFLVDNLLLNESGIRIPSGTRAAKIVHHDDLDGIFSAILVRNQLIKQGIPANNIYTTPIGYGENKEAIENKLKAQKGQMVAVVDFASRIPETAERPAFWSDHHTVEDKPKGATIKPEYPSEAEHLATTSAQGLADPTTIKAISTIDSAAYSKLSDVLDLPKNFKEAGRMERLAIIVNALLPNISKSSRAMRELIKSSSPSLVSVYSNILRVSSLTDKQAEAIKEMSQEKPDWQKVQNIIEQMPSEEMKRSILKKTRTQKTTSLDKKRETFKDQIEKETTPKTTHFKGRDNVIVQTASGRGQPSRFLGSLLTKQDNTRYASLMREWPTMVQIALSPDLPEQARSKVDLTQITDEAIQQVQKEMGTKYEDWAWNIVRTESGGHKAISTISGLGTIGLMFKSDRERLKKIQEYEKRAKALKHTDKKFADIMPDLKKELDDLSAKKDKYKEKRKQVIARLKEIIINKVNSQLKDVKITKPVADQERFKAKKIKEDIKFILDYIE